MMPFEYLLEANRILSSTLDITDLLRKVMSYATAVVDAETSSLLLYDESTRELYFALALTDKESALKKIRLPLGKGIAGVVAQTRVTRIANDVSQDPSWTADADSKTSFTTRSVLAVPLVCRDRLLGVVEAINRKEGIFSDEDARMLEAFAGQAAVAIDNARIFESLYEEKSKLQAIFTQMSDGAILADSTGKKILTNDAVRRLIGSEQCSQPLVKDMFRGFVSTPPLESLLLHTERSSDIELQRGEGKSLFLQGTITAVVDSVGKLWGSVFLVRDVTIEKKDVFFKRSFLSLISHKLRTPLVTILGHCPLLLEDDQLSEVHKKGIRSIYKQGSHLAKLVEKLLQFTLVDSEALSLETVPCRFVDVVGLALADMSQYIEDEKVEIHIDSSVEGLPIISMDKGKMTIVVRNIIENAIKFNPSAGKKVMVRAWRDTLLTGISIADNGPGIPPEEHLRIFDKFYQVEESFTGQVPGAGLGLSLAKHIVEKHGGCINIESSPGCGSVFFIGMQNKGAVA
ncbi:MAG: ATP-binding protein [Endomicrobiales bacterium]|jgi:K+-sensing histidine kinase KdpD